MLQSVHRNSSGAVPCDRHCNLSAAVGLQNTSIGFWLVGGLLTLIYAAVFGLLAYFISEHDPIWGWVIGLNEMFKIVEREDDIIANEGKVFDGFLRTINTEILGAD